jgi:uncharacterized phage protein (TIGR01671 family)
MVYEDNILHYGVSPITATRKDNRVVLGMVLDSTGMTDKNGQEIYDGDILATENKDTEFDTWTRESFGLTAIYWGETTASWAGTKWFPSMHSEDGDVYCLKFVAVVGNIHKNPEMAKKCI